MKTDSPSAALLSRLKSYILFVSSQHLLRLKKKCTSLNFWIMVVCDSLCILIAYLLAYALRFEAFLLYERQLYYAGTLPLVYGVKLPVFYFMGLYNGMWRYTGLRDLQNIIKAVLLSASIIVSLMLLINRFHGFSRAVFIMDAVICLLFICASRVSIRYVLQRSRSLKQQRPKHKKRILLIGAGDAAEKAAREVGDNQRLPYQVIGFVDDNPAKIGMRIHGVPVLGTIDELGDLVDQTRADELLIAVVAISGTQMKRIVGLCQQTGLPFKVLPGLGELIDGKVSVRAIRDISYNDLLGREPVKLDLDKIGNYISDKIVLVTGAGGSIGSELCRQIMRFAPKVLILLDASEANLYTIQMELEHEFLFKDYIAVLGQVQNRPLLDRVFSNHNPQVVFHAAAYKHVPLIEVNPWEAISNNVLAVQILMETAVAYKTERFVLVSTDKAVRPTNVMGASKRLTELIMLSYCHKQWEKCDEFNRDVPDSNCHRMICLAVRFGNVLGSSGSVIPLFKRQIEQGGPVTVTHPEITRYFMSIEEAAQLILQAGGMGENGEIYLLKMGDPVKIDTLARDLISLVGYEPDIDIAIKYTGLRPGEKLFEELITEGEGIVQTNHEKIMVLRSGSVKIEEIKPYLDELSYSLSTYDAIAIKKILNSVIIEYSPDWNSLSVVGVNNLNHPGKLPN